MSKVDKNEAVDSYALKIGSDIAGFLEGQNLGYEVAALASIFVALGAKNAAPARFEELWKRAEKIYNDIALEIKSETEKDNDSQ